MEFKKKILSNGLSIVGEVNPSAKSAAVGFFVKTGSRDESVEISGVSHFLEHMLFKGTDRLSALEVNEAFDKTGAQFNAGTAEEYTIYHAAVLPEYLAEVAKLWTELMRPRLGDDDFNMEKNVIKQEIAMYKDLPDHDVVDRCRSLYFDGHPCGNSILGNIESIDGLTAEQMREYFSQRYAPNNMTLAVTGDFDWGEICSVGEKMCGEWDRKEVGRELADYAGNKKEERVEKSNLNCEHICLMSRGVSAQQPERFAASVVSMIVGDYVGSRFFWELVDKALAETAVMQFGAMDGTGLFCSYFRCSSENSGKVLDTVRKVFESLSADGVTEQEMRAAKNKIVSALVIKNEVSMGRLLDVGFNWVYLKEYRSVADDLADMKAVTIDEVNSVIKQIDLGSFTQMSLGPGK